MAVPRLRLALPRRPEHNAFSTAAKAAAKDSSAEASPSGKQQKQTGSNRVKYISGATVATLSTLAFLHARRMYDDKQKELVIQQGGELEFCPDKKAAFMQMLPLRFISRVWGRVTATNLPEFARPVVYKAWSRAFHADLDDVPLPLEQYPSLRDFFTRGLKDGARPIDQQENCLLSPVDGIVLKYGRVTQPGAVVEQVKGFTYPVSTLLGAEPVSQGPSKKAELEDPRKPSGGLFSFWKSKPKVEKSPGAAPVPPRQFYYCVLYLGPGDYHRVHAPCNWCIDSRRHFTGNLLPVNARAARTIKNLYTVNERVVLEGSWNEGYMAMALVGATNIGSIELKFEPEFKTNSPEFATEPDVKDSCGYCVRRADEIATFNMGSTVVMVFEAPGEVQNLFGVLEDPYPGFKFAVQRGHRVKMGQAIGHY